MGGEWRKTTWGETATLEYGKALRGYSDSPQGARVFGTNGPIGWHSEALWQGPGVIVGRKGAYRGVHYTSEPYWVIDTAYALRPRADQMLDLRWAYYQILYIDPSSIDDGSPVPSTTRADFYAQDVLVPPYFEQREISNLLGALDDKIEVNRRMARTLEAMARALFKSWFVDFDPIHARSQDRQTCLPAILTALFPSRLGARGLPDGWTMTTLGDYSDLNSESWPRAGYPAEIRYVDLANTKWGDINFVEVHSRASAPSRAQRVLRRGDTIVGTVRPGNGSYSLIGDAGLTGSTGFAVLRPKRPELRELVYLSATDETNIERLSTLADGGAYPAVSPALVKETPVPALPAAIVDEFSRATRPIIDRMLACKTESFTLAALRNTLLPKLMSGELRIRDAERAIAVA